MIAIYFYPILTLESTKPIPELEKFINSISGTEFDPFNGIYGMLKKYFPRSHICVMTEKRHVVCTFLAAIEYIKLNYVIRIK